MDFFCQEYVMFKLKRIQKSCAVKNELWLHDNIKSDDGFFMVNCSGCNKWYHKKCMNIQVKVF